MYNQAINPVEANQPLWARSLDSIPTVSQGLLWNAGRGSETIMRGVSGGKAWKNKNTISAAMNNTMRPSNWARFGSHDALYQKGGTYTPFQFLARGGNAVASKLASQDGMFTKYTKFADSGTNAQGKTNFFGTGTAARFSTNAKIASGRASPGLSSFLNNAAFRNTAMGPEIMGGARVSASSFFSSGADDMLKVAASSSGTISRHLLGYQAGAFGARGAGAGLARTAGFESVAKGYASATSDLGKAGLKVGEGGKLFRSGARVRGVGAIAGAGKGARMGAAKIVGTRGLSAVARVAGPIGWAMLAYDVGKFAGNVGRSTISLVGEGAKSLQGSMNKPIFGMGYKDTQFAATSRSRGVMAIQNSRLNARSVLGSEAGMVSAHFG
jgi:hypothetical protein